MNWKDAKHQIAQNENYEDWKDLQRQCDLQFEVDCIEDAGKLMEKRIKELEDGLGTLFKNNMVKWEDDSPLWNATIENVKKLIK